MSNRACYCTLVLGDPQILTLLHAVTNGALVWVDPPAVTIIIHLYGLNPASSCILTFRNDYSIIP